MRDIGGLIWLIFIVIGVVSSIVQSAKRKRAQGAPPSPTPQVRSGQAPVRTQVQVVQRQQVVQQQQVAQQPQMSPQVARLMAQFAAAAEAAAPPKPVQAPPSPPPPKPAPPPPKPAAVDSAQEAAKAFALPRVQRSPLERMFENKHSLVRAVIAAEILGKPRALRDEYP